MTKTEQNKRPSRDERIRKELFPESGAQIFDTKTAGFVPVPIEFRLLLRYLSTSQIRVLLYLHLRAGKESLCFPTVDEIAHDIGVNAPKHVRPCLRELERKGFVRTGSKAGRTYYLIHDPAVIIHRLVDLKEMSEQQLRDMNDLRESIGHDPVEIEE